MPSGDICNEAISSPLNEWPLSGGLSSSSWFSLCFIISSCLTIFFMLTLTQFLAMFLQVLTMFTLFLSHLFIVHHHVAACFLVSLQLFITVHHFPHLSSHFTIFPSSHPISLYVHHISSCFVIFHHTSSFSSFSMRFNDFSVYVISMTVHRSSSCFTSLHQFPFEFYPGFRTKAACRGLEVLFLPFSF